MYLPYTLLLAGCAVGAPVEELSKRLKNGVGLTPAMGFNNWNAGLPAKAFVSLGLKDAGYEYINIDDGWTIKSRGSDDSLVPDPNKWPNGIAAVATQIHGMGLKMGLYGDSGTSTCSGYPGSQGYEEKDAKTLAGWGVDLWKYDNVYTQLDFSFACASTPIMNCAVPAGSNSQTRYTTMRDALASSGRDIYYAMCNWGQDSVWTWGQNTGNSWRISGDVTNKWSSIASIASGAQALAQYAGPGGFNDFDMLEVGNGGLTAAEERAHFGIWAIAKSPLLIGTDLSRISKASLAVLLNKARDVISINQDSLGLAAKYFTPAGKSGPVSGQLYPYWSGKISTGYVIGLVASNGAATLSVNFADIPGLGAGTYSWRELYTNATGTGTSVSATLTSHDMAIFKVNKSSS
ncbi:glycoside hydrolase superfamily [Diaporthe sp. PMI_573]|nr:glycoside hydrolase superfamily [Diaporthaceae sp. PMI_573]